MRDYLLENPWLYEHLFEDNAADCFDFFARHLGCNPTSVLDIGCGSGRDLYKLSQQCPDCVGVDYLPDLVAYANKTYPSVPFQQGDMLDLRLDRNFDAILALGASINYALTNADLDAVMATYRAHARPGTLLLLQPINSCHFIGELNYPDVLEVSHEGKTATAQITYEIDRINQWLTRRRNWRFTPGEATHRDSFKMRLIFPMELHSLLERHGFKVVEMTEVGLGKMGGSSLYAAALFQG